jgi:uncharacterized protein (DUF433 family)
MNDAPNSKQQARLRELIIRNPEITCGTPVFKGTRIPVDLVADMLAQGATAEEILEGYPTLSKEMIPSHRCTTVKRTVPLDSSCLGGPSQEP